jgi:hypothetical protein
MKIVATGILNPGEPGGRRRVSIFPTVTPLGNGKLLATYMVGPGKDSDNDTVEPRWSSDDGSTWNEPAPFATTVAGRRGSLYVVYITPIAEKHLMCAATWVDRETYPGKLLFNPKTEGNPYHRKSWWQTLTSAFSHASRARSSQRDESHSWTSQRETGDQCGNP